MTVERDVAPLAGAWIEIFGMWIDGCHFAVAPLAGAWIEIRLTLSMKCPARSLPSRERGLKCQTPSGDLRGIWSLPSRERGLKFQMD